MYNLANFFRTIYFCKKEEKKCKKEKLPTVMGWTRYHFVCPFTTAHITATNFRRHLAGLSDQVFWRPFAMPSVFTLVLNFVTAHLDSGFPLKIINPHQPHKVSKSTNPQRHKLWLTTSYISLFSLSRLNLFRLISIYFISYDNVQSLF
jgi:hypothetical protein